ncbi:hypothetical protein KR054_005781 [Drosophila jambulina]|nr:hypothetical protein KR054_005781 [Drosophila jambulina]
MMKQKGEQKTLPSSPGLAVRMRPGRPKAAEDPIEQKLKEVKEHKPHFDEMTSYISTLLKPVDCATLTLKAAPVQETSPGKAPSPDRAFSPAKPTSPAKCSLPAGSSLPPPKQDSNLEASTSGNSSSKIKSNLPELPPRGSSTPYPSNDPLKLPGSPILNPSEHIRQEQFVSATIMPPPPPLPPAELMEAASGVEMVNTWECTQVDPALEEVMVVANGVTMFIRNPDGSYDLYTGLQPAVPEAESANVREITFSDGPLVILTRDDDGKLTYDPEDTVVIDIADNSLFVLNTEETSNVN